jgi:acetoin utilization deacetylase AcuC-like enzyme
VAISAGFDRHEADWGRMLTTEDYCTIGELVKEFAARVCQGRRYGVLEGGYNHQVLGRNVKALLDGMV